MCVRGRTLLPETYINDVSLLLSDNLKVPLPDFGRNGLTDGAQDSQVLHGFIDIMIPRPLEEPQRGGSNVELRDGVLIDHIPVSREVGIGRRALKDDRGNTQEQRSVNDIGVPRDPSYITPTEELVGVVDIKDIFARGRCANEVPGRRVHDALGLAGRTRCVQQEKGILRVHWLGGEVRGPLRDLLVPPPIPTLGKGDFSPRALVDQDVRDVGALLERIIHDLLGSDQLAAALALVRRDHDLGLRINDPVAQRIRGEAGEDDRVHGSDTGAGQERNEGFGNHGKVDGHGIPLLDAHLLQNVGGRADFAEQFAIGQGASLFRIIRLVDNGRLVGVLEGVTIDAVV